MVDVSMMRVLHKASSLLIHPRAHLRSAAYIGLSHGASMTKAIHSMSQTAPTRSMSNGVLAMLFYTWTPANHVARVIV
jgi:hypothetical protein